MTLNVAFCKGKKWVVLRGPSTVSLSLAGSTVGSILRGGGFDGFVILGDVQFVEFAVEAGDADAQVLGGFSFIVVVLSQAPEDVLTLEMM